MLSRDQMELKRLQANIKMLLDVFTEEAKALEYVTLMGEDISLRHTIQRRIGRFVHYKMLPYENLPGVAKIFLDIVKDLAQSASTARNHLLRAEGLKLLNTMKSQLEVYAKEDKSAQHLAAALEAKENPAPVIAASQPAAIEVDVKDLVNTSDAFADFRCPLSLELIDPSKAVKVKGQYYSCDLLRDWVRQHHNNPLTREPLFESALVIDSEGYKKSLLVVLEAELKKLGMVDPQLKETLEAFQRDNEWSIAPVPSVPSIAPVPSAPSLARAPQPSPGLAMPAFFTNILGLFSPSPAPLPSPVAPREMEQAVSKFNALILGAPGVGKSSLILRLSGEPYPDQGISTIGADYKEVELGRNVTMRLFDDWEDDPAKRAWNIGGLYRNKQVVLVAFDITHGESSLDVERWLQHVVGMMGEGVQILLVGTKADLHSIRRVPSEDIQEIADRYRLHYIEVSAKTSHNLQELKDLCQTMGLALQEERRRIEGNYRR